MGDNNESNYYEPTKFTHETHDENEVLHITSDLEEASAAEFDQHLSQIIENLEVSVIELNFNLLDFINSYGIRQLLMAKKRAEDAQKKLVIKNANKGIMRLMVVMGVENTFEFDPPLEEEE